MRVRRIRRSEQRRGSFSLIEVLVSITLTAVLFGSTAILTVLLFRLERTGRSDLAETMTMGRLVAEFRSDVHAAIHAEFEGDLLLLQGWDDQRVHYRIEDEALIRREGIPGGTDRVERYRLRPGNRARWEPNDEDRAGPIVLVIESAGAQTEPSLRRSPIRVEAMPGRDHRFARGGE